MKPALRGVPVFVLATLLLLVQPCFAQDGPLLPGLEPSDPASPPSSIEAAEVPSSLVEAPLPVDDGITPLGEDGQPMNGPESDRPMRLPAPPPLPVTPRTPTHLNSSPSGPSLLLEKPPTAGKSADDHLESEPQKRNLWQRSTDALRDLKQPKSNKDSAVEQDAASQWQLLRQRELEQQRREQRQLQQRELQQRELQRRQFEQRQLQQRRSLPPQGSWDPRTRTQGSQSQPAQRPVTVPGVEARAKAPVARSQTSSRRQPQRFNSPPSSNPTGSQNALPSARGRKPAQPREAKNEPRSPWERS